MRDDQLSDQDIRSLWKLAYAVDKFEPYPSSLLSTDSLQRLAQAGLVETGPSCRPAVAPVGYRLTEQGWRLAESRRPAPVDLVA